MRASGILMPVFSLPGPFGIGTLGAEAFAFVDFLARARQTYWQILPIGPTGYGDSLTRAFPPLRESLLHRLPGAGRGRLAHPR